MPLGYRKSNGHHAREKPPAAIETKLVRLAKLGAEPKISTLQKPSSTILPV